MFSSSSGILGFCYTKTETNQSTRQQQIVAAKDVSEHSGCITVWGSRYIYLCISYLCFAHFYTCI